MKIGKRQITSATLQNSFDRRTVMIGAVQGGVGLLLAGRLTYLAVAQNEKYELQAESNRVNLSLIPPRRGWILDRNGSPLASNKADFRVDVIPDRMDDQAKTIAVLGSLLKLSALEIADLDHKIEQAHGFAPVEVASGLDWDSFAAVSVRLPDLPGVVTQRGFSRYYPTGPAVGHLIGYVGSASKEEWQEEDKAPLLITPGYKIGKDGLEKQFEKTLRGKPGGRRVEVTAGGRIVRDLETREDVPGNPLKLTIDGPLQDYAARRIGLESGSCVVMDCRTGDVLCAASMPSFDPNSFSDGIGAIEWKMLSEDDHVPLRNKVLRGLYPPGSTVKPAVALAFLKAGLDPEESVFCGGGLRVGNRVFHCYNRRGHGQTNMAKGIYQSCDVYFYYFAQKLGMDVIAEMCRLLGMGEEFPLPVAGQSYGTVPDPAWKKRKYGTEWANFDTVNATIGQGYMLVNPLQQAVMSSRLAYGKKVMPRLIHSEKKPQFESLGIPQEHIDFVHQAMSDVVNGPGTAGRARLPIPDVLMAGKTGTAQVVSLSVGRGKGGLWKHRDHGHFISFAPFDKPLYACAVSIEHGGGSGSAYPIARDVMTFLFDPAKALEMLHDFEKQWGGTAMERLDRKYAAYSAAAGETVPGANAEPSPGATETPQPAASPSGTPNPSPRPTSTAPAEAAPQPSPTPTPASAPSPAPLDPAPARTQLP